MSGDRRALRVLAAAALAAAVACSSGGRPPPRTVLRVVMANDWAGVAPVIDAVRDFERAHPGVRVDIEGVYFEYMAETVRSAIARGDPPDAVQWHAFAAGAQKLAQPLDDLWRRRIGSSEFLAGSVEDVTWAGVTYGVPLDTNAMLLIYNPSQFAAARVPEPDDTLAFDGFRRMAAGLTPPDLARRAIALPSSTWHTYGWVRANGGEVVEVGKDGRPRFTLDRPENVEALTFLAGLVRDQVAFPPAGIQGDRVDAFALFRGESTALHASGSWDAAALDREQMAWRHRAALMPRGMTGRTEGTAMGGSSFFVPMGSAHRELAFEFMLRMIDDATALRLAKEEGRLPVRPRVYRDPFFATDELQTFLRQLQRAHPFRLESFPEANRAFGDAIEEVLPGRKEAGAALAEAQRRADASVPK